VAAPVWRREWNGIFLPRELITTAPQLQEIAERAWRELAPGAQTTPCFRQESFRALAAIWAGKTAQINLPHELHLRRERDGWFVFRTVAEWAPQTVTTLPAFLYTDFFSLTVTVAPEKMAREVLALRARHPDFLQNSASRPVARQCAELAAGSEGVEYIAAGELPLTLRLPAAGETMTPLNFPAPQKITAIFGAAKSPARYRLPLLTDRNGAVWYAPLRLADRLKITAATTEVWQLRFRSHSGAAPLNA
jgi:hypothetical protein